jgi:hypothetical protein
MRLQANNTFEYSLAPASVGRTVYLDVVQGTNGAKTLTFDSRVVWPAGQAPVWNTVAGSVNTFAFVVASTGRITGYSTKY